MAYDVVGLLAQLLRGDVLGAIASMWSQTLNLGYIIFAIPFFAVLGVVYMKSEDAIVPTILAILFSFGLGVFLPPEGRWIAGLFVALALTGQLYAFFHRGRY